MVSKNKSDKEDEEEEETTAAAEEPKPEKGETQKHAVVLTGGIDSTVMLHDLKKTLGNAQLVPIVAGDKKYVDYGLDNLKIKSSPVKVELPDSANAKDEEWDEFFEKLAKDDIVIVHFANNYEEAQRYDNKNSAARNRLNLIASKHGITVSTPLETNTKQSIIQRGVDEYFIDLEKLAPPAQKDDPIRKEAFRNIYSQRLAKRIDDPYTDEPRIAKEQEGG